MYRKYKGIQKQDQNFFPKTNQTSPYLTGLDLPLLSYLVGIESTFLAEPSSTSIFYVSKQLRPRRDCGNAQAHLSLGCLQMG